jgi:ribosomal protein L7/L12
MPEPAKPLPVQVVDALQSGHILDAIKLLRDAKGLGLQDAKDVADRYLRGNTVVAAPSRFPGAPPPDVVSALQQGRKIEAIRLMRERTGLGLKEAKDAVDAFEAQTQLMQGTGSPGEVPRSDGTIWWVIGGIVVAWALYHFSGRAIWV